MIAEFSSGNVRVILRHDSNRIYSNGIYRRQRYEYIEQVTGYIYIYIILYYLYYIYIIYIFYLYYLYYLQLFLFVKIINKYNINNVI